MLYHQEDTHLHRVVASDVPAENHGLQQQLGGRVSSGSAEGEGGAVIL